MKAMIVHFKRQRSFRRASSSGFTLIEMMVTLALTMIMMYLFARIFQITGDFVTRQKGIGENDQSARILTTALKTDLQARTMRILAPFHPNMPAIAGPGVTFTDTQRRGYFYYSENNPADDTDDVLQFTIDMTTLQPGNPLLNSRLSGLGMFLPAPWQAGTTYPNGTLVRPVSSATATGFVYKNKGAPFVSGGSEPNWSNPTGPPAFPPLAAGQTVSDGTGTWTTLVSPLDQPDGDDGIMIYDSNGNETINPAGLTPNNTGASQFAEVSYFLRHGNLYRRVLLIRQPYDPTGSASSSQPYDSDSPPAQLIPGLYPPYPMSPTAAGSGNFLTDFDYSARVQPYIDPSTWQANSVYLLGANVMPACPDSATGFIYTCTTAGTSGALQPTWPTTAGMTVTDNTVVWTAVAPPTNATGVSFLGSGSAENSLDNLTIGSLPVGRPDNRFGFDQIFATTGSPPARNGAPREYDSNGAFFGRYTDEETSNGNFLFPGALPTGGSPVGWTTPLTLDSTRFTMSLGNPATTSLAGGPRRGEDILLTNVVSFDVKILDPLYSEYNGPLPLPSPPPPDLNRNGIIEVGPTPAFADVGHSAPGGCFRGAGSPNGTANVLPQFGPNPNTAGSTTYTNNNVFDTWFRQFHFDNVCRSYDNADVGVLYAPAPYRPRIGNTWQPNTAYSYGTLVDPVQTANGYVYECTTAGTSGSAPTSPQLDPFSLQNTIGSTIADGTVTWTVLQPLSVQAIQITVKYLDPSQNLLRQVTIVQSLTQ
jgi:type II secretory pathway pseudopilin PulG